MNRVKFLLLPLLIAGCTEDIPSIDIICTNGNIETTFRTERNSNSLVGSDGSKTAFYADNLFEVVFVNLNHDGKSERVVKYYGSDPGLEIIENGSSETWICKHNA